MQIFPPLFSYFFCSFVVPDVDVVPGQAEGIPRDVKPARASQQLVGVFAMAQKVHQALELGGVLGADVGSLTLQVLGVTDTAHLTVHGLAAEATIDNNRTTDGLAGRLQEHQAAVGHVDHLLHGGLVGRVTLPVAELRQGKVFRESCVFH